MLAGIRTHDGGEGNQADFYRNLRQALISIFGAPISSVVFHSLGEFEGNRLAKTLSSSAIVGENWVGMVTSFLELQGLARFETVDLQPKKSTARFQVNNLIDEGQKAYINGEGGGVGCYYIRGLLQKFLETLLGKGLQVTETKCRLHGAEVCEYSFLSTKK